MEQCKSCAGDIPLMYLMSILDLSEMVKEIKEKIILHWNCRGLKEIPEVIRNCGDHIQEIYLKWNQLTTLPPWIVELSNVTNLYIYGNLISKLPTELGLMSQLTVLDLSANKLEDVPICIGSLLNLKSLLLSNNCIKVLPTELSKLCNLELLCVAENKISILPEWIGSLPKLKELNADKNDLKELPNRLTLAMDISLISVCSNRLRYLPMNGFASSPCIRFDGNDYLNYISYPLLLQLICQTQMLGIRDSRHSLAYGCFKVDHKCNMSNTSLKINIEVERSTNAYIMIELPRQLLKIHQVNENKIVSLWELALRKLYREKYDHKLNISFSPLHVKVSYASLAEMKHKDCLVHLLGCASYDLLKNGPSSICVNVNCQQPIFTEAWILTGISHLAYSVVTIALCCSKICAAEFATVCNWTTVLHWHCIQ